MTTVADTPGRSSSDALTSIFELTRAVATATHPDQIYEAALRALRESLAVDKSSILLFEHSETMGFKAWHNLSEGYRQAVAGHSPWDRTSKNPEPVLVEDVRLEASLNSLRNVIEAEGIRSLAFIPLVIAGRLLGKFMLYYPEPHQFTTHELLVARTIASQVAFAIDQQEHHDEHEHLDAVFRSAITGFTQIDTSAHFVMVNDHFCNLVGRSREELLELDSFAISHPDDRQITADCLHALEQGAPHFVLEKRYVRPDGREVWVQNNFSAIRDISGELKGAIAVVIDMTERKMQDRILRESERRFRELIGALGLAVYTTDADGRVTLYNDAARALWGRSPEIGQDLWCGSWKIFETDGVTEMPLDTCPMAKTLKENQPVRGVEIIVEREDGTRANILPHPTPLRDTDGNLVGAVNVLVDITELRQAEAAVRKSEERFRTLTAHAPVGIFVTDPNGNCLMVNQQWLDFSGLPNEEAALGKGWVDALHEDDRERVLAQWSSFTGGEHQSYQGEFRYRQPDGSVIWVKSAATYIEGTNDEAAGYIGTLTDITALKQTEELKDQFLSLVSHELRTPLATIYGGSRLLKDRFDRIKPEDRTELLSDVVSEAERLQRIIENLLLLTRLDATGIDVEPLAITVLARRITDKVKARNPHRAIHLKIDDDIPPVVANPTYIELVFENLLGNAIKYSPNDAAVDMAIRQQDDRVVVTFLDRGIGFDDEQAKHLFEAFYRSKQARTMASGVGIGLAVCKRVLEVQNGTIWGHARPDGGSEFGFSLKGAPELM